MVNVCMRAPPGRSCSPDRDLTLNLMHESGKKGGLFYAEAAGISRQVIPSILNRMDFLAKQNKSHLYFLGLGKIAGAGMLSYPNFGGPNKDLNHPDAYSLAMLSELQSLDFRVLVLQRDPRDIIASVKRRNFGGLSEIRILTQSADALYTQLALISPGFYRCIQYAHLNTMNDRQKHDLSNFLHPGVIPDVLNAMVGRLHYKNDPTSSTTDSTDRKPHPTRNESRSNKHPVFQWNEQLTGNIITNNMNNYPNFTTK